MADIYLHIGLPKTGSTTIQAGLDRARAALAEHGVLVPGANHDAHRRAAFDLIGQRVTGWREPVAGAFDALVAELGEYDGDAAIVSEEGLVRARPRHVRRVARCLSGHRLHVVVAVRDLARTLTSAWQQAVVGGSATTWSDYAAAPVDADLRRLDEVDDGELLAAARSGLTALALAQADLLRRHRRAVARRYGYAPSWSELADSRARASWFGVQRAAVRVADGSGPLAPAARRALRGWLRSGQW